MRSHARVDLFAKAVALTGLGCLGLAGAVIDSWPETSLPAVRTVADFGGSGSVVTLIDVPGFGATSNPAGMTFTLGGRRRSPRAVAERVPLVQPAAFRRAVSFAARQPARPHVRPMPVTSDLPDLSSAGVELLPAPALSAFISNRPPLMPTSTLVLMQPDDDGFISGVLKKTGSSVSSSFGKAGSSLVGAFRLVGGAVKKATRF
jgi:hypothetical protein